MTKLTITRGLPGCGKTTESRRRVAENPRRLARVNRDDIGAQLHGRRFYEDPDLMRSTERAITVAQHAQIAELLKRGWDVICDDTNLARRVARDLRNLAVRCGAEFEIVDMLDVPLETVFAQNEMRAGTDAYVPVDVIERMIRRYTGKQAYEVPLNPEPTSDLDGFKVYEPEAGLPDAVMVDIDGTVALMGSRSPYDESLVHEDLPNEAVIESVREAHDAGKDIVFCSGRTAAAYDATYAWVERVVQVPIAGLFMRKVGDTRKDDIVKLELFDENIRGRWNISRVYDDRDQVVRAWRSIGLPVFQVAEGNF